MRAFLGHDRIWVRGRWHFSQATGKNNISLFLRAVSRGDVRSGDVTPGPVIHG